MFVLTGPASGRRFLLTNPDGYSLRYNGLVTRWRSGRQRVAGARFVYYSRASGLQATSGATAADAQASTVAPNV